jgi:hypothetical protein
MHTRRPLVSGPPCEQLRQHGQLHVLLQLQHCLQRLWQQNVPLELRFAHRLQIFHPSPTPSRLQERGEADRLHCTP